MKNRSNTGCGNRSAAKNNRTPKQACDSRRGCGHPVCESIDYSLMKNRDVWTEMSSSPCGCGQPVYPCDPRCDTTYPCLFNPCRGCGYVQGQLVLYNGKVYIAAQNSPAGTPGSSPDYILIAGPCGAVGVTVYDPAQAACYQPGQIIMYNSALYVVQLENPSGTPGSSPGYLPV